ncbi:wolframin-like isoform X3 [Pomacea canaliculata]|nr:wolframin-like isoform X3 [Pomacea canaliculata]
MLAHWIQEADNGSEDYQAKLGVHFLSLADAGVNREENASQAIHWLVLASRQGNKDATANLQKCAETGTGITESNKDSVKWCLTTSVSEKKIRQAARNLFHQINKTHKDVISREEYLEAISGLTDSIRQQKLLAAAGKKIGDQISENEFMKMLSRRVQGKLTLTSEEMDEASAAYQSAGLLTKMFVYPRQTATVIFDQSLEWASKEGLGFVTSMVPTNQIYILAMLFAYSFLTPAFILLIVPLFVFYLSSIALIIATLQMFYKKKKQKDAADLASVLQKFDVNIDLEDTQSQYSWNSLTPYWVFFGILPIVVISFALSNKAYIPCSEFFVIGTGMAIFCFIGLSDEYDKLTFLLLFANTVASLPVFFHNFPDILLVARVIQILTQPFFSFSLGPWMKFNLSIPSVFYMVIPVFFLRLAMKNSWSGMYRIVVPHLVCYFWWNVMTAFYPFTTWKGLARATAGYLLLPFLLPLGVLVVFGLILYLLYLLFQTQVFGKLFVTIILLSIPLLLTQTKSIFGNKANKSLGSARKVIMGIFSALAIVSMIFIQIPQLTPPKTLELSWEDYKLVCVPTSSENVPAYQIRCAQFSGTKVTWKGKWMWSKISKIENTAESVLNALPSFISRPLYCIYGERRPDCDETSMPKDTFRHCKLIESAGQSCHVQNHNVYSFQIGVNIENATVFLEAGNGFLSVVMAMKNENEVEFTGSLVGGLGTSTPSIKLIKVLNREMAEIMNNEQEEDEQFYTRSFKDAARVTFNFFFFPVFEYSAF